MKYIKSMMLGMILVATASIAQARMPGSSSDTFGPVHFTPANNFAGEGLDGNYFVSDGTATIHDPSGKNPQTYDFDSVISIEAKGVRPPTDLTCIGSFPTPNWVPMNISCSGCPDGITRLYGKLAAKQ